MVFRKWAIHAHICCNESVEMWWPLTLWYGFITWEYDQVTIFYEWVLVMLWSHDHIIMCCHNVVMWWYVMMRGCYDDKMLWWQSLMMTCWKVLWWLNINVKRMLVMQICDPAIPSAHADVVTRLCDGMMTCHHDMMPSWHADVITWWRCHDGVKIWWCI